MIGKFASIGALVIGGIIIADVLTHPSGTAAASQGISTVTSPAYAALLGGSNTGGK